MKTVVRIEEYLASNKGLQAIFFEIIYMSGPRPGRNLLDEPLRELGSYELAAAIALRNGWVIYTEPDTNPEPAERVSLRNLLK